MSRPLGEPEQGLWRPLTVATWRLQWHGPEHPGPLRAGNLVLHALASVLVLLLGRRLGLAPTGATAAALLFAVHPVHAEAVAWISGRSELLATTLVLAAWVTWSAPWRGAALASALLVAGAGLAKENALAAPALFVLADLALGRGLRRGPLVLAALAVAATFACRLAVLPHALPGAGPYHDVPFGERLVVAINILGRGLRLLVWPDPLRVEYHHSELLVARPGDYVVVAVGLAAAVLLWRRQRLVALGLALLPVAMLPVLHLLPIGEPFAERFLYLPSVPFCLALGGLFAAWGRLELKRGRGVGPSVLALAATVLVALPLSRHAVRAFHDDLTLWTSAVAAAPDSAIAHYNLGDFLDREGRYLTEDRERPGSLDALATSLALSPRHVYSAFAHQTLGTHALGAKGLPPDPAAASRHFRAALDRLPDLADARINLAGMALARPDLVDPVEGVTLLLPLRSRDDLSPEQAAAVEDLWAQLSVAASAAASSTSDGNSATGTSSDDGS